jgi:hypothetical protein
LAQNFVRGSVVEVAGGKAQREIGGVACGVMTQFRSVARCTPRRPVELRGGWGEVSVAEYPKKLAKKVPSA